MADEILRNLGDAPGAGYFNDREYCEWFAEMRSQAEALDSPPIAFEDYRYGWRCGTTDITPPPGWEQVK